MSGLPDYEKAMLHIELALRRTSDDLRQGGETNIENALWSLANELAGLVEEERLARAIPPAERGGGQ